MTKATLYGILFLLATAAYYLTMAWSDQLDLEQGFKYVVNPDNYWDMWPRVFRDIALCLLSWHIYENTKSRFSAALWIFIFFGTCDQLLSNFLPSFGVFNYTGCLIAVLAFIWTYFRWNR